MDIGPGCLDWIQIKGMQLGVGGCTPPPPLSEQIPKILKNSIGQKKNLPVLRENFVFVVFLKVFLSYFPKPSLPLPQFADQDKFPVLDPDPIVGNPDPDPSVFFLTYPVHNPELIYLVTIIQCTQQVL